MTRCEEELRVGTTTRQSGTARLRKYVVTKHETRTVPVQREEVRVEREPITDANAGEAMDGPALSEEEHEGRAAHRGAGRREARRAEGAGAAGQGRRPRRADGL